MKRRVWVVFVGALALGGLGVFQATAAPPPPTFTWNGSLGPLWSVGSNWTPTGPPSPGSHVVFPDTATSKVSTNNIAGTSNFDSIDITGNGYTINKTVL